MAARLFGPVVLVAMCCGLATALPGAATAAPQRQRRHGAHVRGVHHVQHVPPLPRPTEVLGTAGS